MFPSADKLYGDVDVIFQQGVASVHTAKGTKSWISTHDVPVFDWPGTFPDLNSMMSCLEDDEGHQRETQWETGRQSFAGYQYIYCNISFLH